MNDHFNFDPPNIRFKILRLSGGNYLIAIACGNVDADRLMGIFRKASELCQTLPNCKILIDLEAAKLMLEGSDIAALFHAVRPRFGRDTAQIAVVCSACVDVSDRLSLLRNSLRHLGDRLEIFNDTKSAVSWLRDGR